jgi:hypothetical protein
MIKILKHYKYVFGFIRDVINVLPLILFYLS